MQLKQLFSPPFIMTEYNTSIWDKNTMVWDFIGKDYNILRVRAWGYLNCMHTVNAADMQDRLIEFTVDTLNERFGSDTFFAMGGDITKSDGTTLTQEEKQQIPQLLTEAWENLDERLN